MPPRPWLTASALIVPLAIPLAGRSARPAPPQTHYRIEIVSQQNIDLTAFGQGQRNQTARTVGYVAITTSDSAGGTIVAARVDSVQLDTALHAPQAMLDSLKGASSRNFYGAGGQMRRLSRDNASTAVLSLGLDAMMRRFVPPSAAHRKPGATWTDTVDVSDTLPNGQVTTRTVSNYITSEETLEGAKATRVAASYSSAVQGSQSGDGGEGSFDGTGTGTSTWYFAADASVISGTSKSNQSLSFTGGGAPAPIPITVQNDVTVTRIK